MAYQVADVLADNAARRPMFGNVLDLTGGRIGGGQDGDDERLQGLLDDRLHPQPGHRGVGGQHGQLAHAPGGRLPRARATSGRSSWTPPCGRSRTSPSPPRQGWCGPAPAASWSPSSPAPTPAARSASGTLPDHAAGQRSSAPAGTPRAPAPPPRAPAPDPPPDPGASRRAKPPGRSPLSAAPGPRRAGCGRSPLAAAPAPLPGAARQVAGPAGERRACHLTTSGSTFILLPSFILPRTAGVRRRVSAH